ncbi:hypothetical protein ABL78_7731 [Leptomonas seymouri]|uniref:Uncharacterized protein n=1 Tax=Leptomonas seymouri TaxID=5684 RepID=A0A0N1PC42_LEPSE|nr:hypothetical protein ABL78_7731 [Leptomonas seymouri]|eukprot:KPI83241.1 hypothetical protein ABL78_7731 [Leptomonas seymouri]
MRVSRLLRRWRLATAKSAHSPPFIPHNSCPRSGPALLCRVGNSANGAITAGHPLRAASSWMWSAAYLCARRLSNTRSTHHRCAATPVPAWQRLVRSILPNVQLCEAASNDASAAPTCAIGSYAETLGADVLCRTSPLRCLWLETYHSAFQQVEGAASALVSTHGASHSSQRDAQAPIADSVASEKIFAEGFPEEAEELPAFVQALGVLATTLKVHIRRRASADRSESLPPLADAAVLSLFELHEWLSEVQALLLYIGRHQLRHLIPPAFCIAGVARSSPPHFNAKLPEELVPTDHTHAADDESHVEPRVPHTPPFAASRSAQLQPIQPPPASLRPLSRPREERLQNKAPPLPIEDLLRLVVLIEAAQTILEVAQPPPLASSVRAELYTVLLGVLGASEQLSSSALASLTTCLARCMDSYITRQQLPPLTAEADSLEKSAIHHWSPGTSAATSGPPDDDAREVFEGCLLCFYRPVERDRSTPDAVPTMRASVLEAAEAAQLARYRGGLSTLLRPTEVLQQLSVLANVTQHRIARTLRGAEAAAPFPSAGDPSSCDSSADEEGGQGVKHVSTVRLAKQEQLQEGMLGLLSLEERKARHAAVVTAASGQQRGSSGGQQRQPARPRRTIAAIHAEARMSAEEGLQSAEGAYKDDKAGSTASPLAPSASFFKFTDITLTDAAEVCSALAAMGLRGGGSASSSEEPLWALVVDFTCAEMDAMAQARDSAHQEEEAVCAHEVDGHAASGTALASCLHDQGAREGREAVVQQFMQNARDIAFALDRVGFTQGYDRVMAQLVRCKFLRAPIAAPSAGARAMKEVNIYK